MTDVSTVEDDQFYESIVNGSETLDSLNWCLYQLEKIQTSSSVSDMAKNKFKMMLNNELSVLSKGSKSGQTIMKHITDTYYGKSKNHIILFLNIHILQMCKLQKCL